MSLQALDNFINNADSEIAGAMTRIERIYLNRVKDILERFKQQNGLFVSDISDTQLFAELQRELEKVFFKGQYPAAINNYLAKFDTVQSLTLQTIPIPSGAVPLSLTIERKLIADSVISNLATKSGINNQFIRPIQSIIYNAVTFGTTFRDTEETIRGLILTTPDRNGLLTRYATQITRDSLNQFAGSIYNKSVEIYKFKKFRYVNSIIEDSRQNCIEMANGTGSLGRFLQKDGTYKVEDLPALIRIMEKRGGWIEGTNESNFFINRGGYNCRHKAIPAI